MIKPRLNFFIPLNGKQKILTDFYPGSQGHPLVIFCHGFKGFKNWGHFDLLPAYFNNAGFHFLKFNFSLSGSTLENPGDITDLDSFAQNTISQEMADLSAVLDWVESDDETVNGLFTKSGIYVIGHSRGGSIAILTASKDERIRKLVTWSAVGDFNKRFPTGKDLETWKLMGVQYILNKRTGIKMPQNYSYYEDYQANKSAFDIISAERKLTIPHLLLHGTKDETVLLGEALHLMSSNEHCSLIKLHNATHTFGGHHPYPEDSLPQHTEAAVKYSIAFLQNE